MLADASPLLPYLLASEWAPKLGEENLMESFCWLLMLGSRCSEPSKGCSLVWHKAIPPVFFMPSLPSLLLPLEHTQVVLRACISVYQHACMFSIKIFSLKKEPMPQIDSFLTWNVSITWGCLPDHPLPRCWLQLKIYQCCFELIWLSFIAMETWPLIVDWGRTERLGSLLTNSTILLSLYFLHFLIQESHPHDINSRSWSGKKVGFTCKKVFIRKKSGPGKILDS